MEYSKNFNFSLPSRDNDVDLADINEISNNFRKIDENAVKKEVGKGLSTNDFTNEEKKRLANALTSESTDISLSNSLLQLTANGKAVGEGVTLPSGLRLINSITVADGETATVLKISRDVDGAKFSLHNIMFAARLNLSSAQNVTIRLRTNGGHRYLVYKAGVAANTILFVSGESKVFSVGTYTNAEYLTSTIEQQGITSGNAFQTFSSDKFSNTNISDIEILLYDTKNQFVELQPGTTLELWGC